MELLSGLISVYVYYRVAQCDWNEAENLIRSLQARLACRSGIAGRLLKKRGEPGLWMEVYESIAQLEAFERHLAQLEDEFDIAVFIDGVRHREVFEAHSGQVSN
ncbi:MAG: DUF4936 family protein [Thiobacillaceae bacterium]|jgi:hypothetical protein